MSGHNHISVFPCDMQHVRTLSRVRLLNLFSVVPWLWPRCKAPPARNLVVWCGVEVGADVGSLDCPSTSLRKTTIVAKE